MPSRDHVLATGSLSGSFRPLGIPRPARAVVARSDLFSYWLVCAPIVLTTLFGKLSIAPFNTQGLGLGYPLLVLALLVGLLSGRVGIDPRRGTYCALMVGIFGLVQIVRQEPFSLLSVVFMAVSSVLYTLSITRSDRGPEGAMRFVTNFASLIALCGIIQFAAQFAIGRKYAFPIENFVPRAYLIVGFNYLNPLYYGASILKSNGLFLLEPSFFSQLMAIALIVELATTRRVLRIALFSLAITFSYSGTGLLVLAISLPLLLILDRRLDLLFVMVGVAVLALAFAIPLRLDVFLHRIGEFGTPGSSAWLRFVGWIYLAEEAMGKDVWRALFGYGSGTFRVIAHQAPYAVAETLHSKILIEYGLLGFLSYVGFLMYCIFTAPVPITIRVAVAALQFMAGAFSEPVMGITLSLLLLTPRKPEPAPSHEVRPSTKDALVPHARTTG